MPKWSLTKDFALADKVKGTRQHFCRVKQFFPRCSTFFHCGIKLSPFPQFSFSTYKKSHSSKCILYKFRRNSPNLCLIILKSEVHSVNNTTLLIAIFYRMDANWRVCHHCHWRCCPALPKVITKPTLTPRCHWQNDFFYLFKNIEYPHNNYSDNESRI